MLLPLNEQVVEVDHKSITGNAKLSTIPALHPSRKEDIEFVRYLPPPQDLSDRGGYEEWMERMRFIEADLHRLLQLPHDKFWCQAVFDEKLHRCLDTYLRQAPRSYDSLADLPGEALTVHQEIHRLVFMTYLRMATYKESNDYHIAPKVFGDILYENFIFDIPKFMDLSVLYGRENGPLLTKMISNVFSQQPKYRDDLRETLPTVCQVFDSIRMKCGVGREGGAGLTPQKLNQPHGNQDPLVTMTTDDFEDVVYFFSDTSITLSVFLDVYPQACEIFQHALFPQRLAVFYDTMTPVLAQNIRTRLHESPRTKMRLKRRLKQGCKHLIKAFRQIIQVCCIQPILEHSSSKVYETQQNVEVFLDIFSEIQGERRFLADYESENTFQDALDIILQANCMIDETRIQFIQDGINSAFATFGKRKKPKGAKNAGGRESPDGSAGSDEGGAVGGVASVGGATGGGASAIGGRTSPGDAHVGAYSHSTFEGDGACARTVTGVELDSLITSIKDLLPELGEGFIERCLEEFDYDQERVINSVLEDKLPVPLRDLERTLARAPKEQPVSYLTERRCVYDFDEFDVFNRDTVDMSKISQGKKEKNPLGLQSLDDKSELAGLKSLYDRYGSGIMGESVYEENLYEDEYDDTYDTGIIGADDADSADELKSRKFVTPRVLEQRREPKEGRSHVSNGSEGSSEEEKNKDEFVANPAVLRARAEERAQWKAQRDNKKRGQGQQKVQRPPAQTNQGQGQTQRGESGGQGERKYDVKGKPKGQGQEANVTRNRNFKDKHKSSLANHNRKAMADRKRKV